jgi:hypothetical protein
MKKLLTIATLVSLAALPLAAQAQDPPAEEPLAQEQEYGTETQPAETAEAMPPSVDSAEPIEPLVGEAETDAQTEVDAGQEELPRTASPLALIALLGGAGAAAGLGVRRLRTR